MDIEEREKCPVCNKNHNTYPNQCEKKSKKMQTEIQKKMNDYLKRFKPLLELLKY